MIDIAYVYFLKFECKMNNTLEVLDPCVEGRLYLWKCTHTNIASFGTRSLGVLSFVWFYFLHKMVYSRTPKQTPHFDTSSEIYPQYPSRTLAKNEIMKMFKSAQNIGNRARKCTCHCFSCEMGYLSTRLRSFTRLKARERFWRLVLR